MDAEKEVPKDSGPGERRSAPRRRTLKGALVVFDHHQRALDCLVRNLSDSGAILTLDSTRDVPDRFEILLPHDHLMAEARAVWRTYKEVGVEITGPWRPHARKG